MPSRREILQVAHAMTRELDGDLSLDSLAEKAGWSRAHLHRDFRRVAGETPKQFALRLAAQRWIEAQGQRAKGAPWEQYLTDPGEEPDPTKWRTLVVWPLEP